MFVRPDVDGAAARSGKRQVSNHYCMIIAEGYWTSIIPRLLIMVILVGSIDI